MDNLHKGNPIWKRWNQHIYDCLNICYWFLKILAQSIFHYNAVFKYKQLNCCRRSRINLFIINHYIINRYFKFMRAHHDRCGKMCTEVHETKRKFIVDKSPLEILNDSIRAIGFNLKGAIETSRFLLGDLPMCPVMVNPINRIVVFPTRSYKNEDTIWFNPFHIKRTTSFNGNTTVLFSSGSTLTIPIRLSSFNTKIKNAEQLGNITAGNDLYSFSFILDPSKRVKVKNKDRNKLRGD